VQHDADSRETYVFCENLDGLVSPPVFQSSVLLRKCSTWSQTSCRGRWLRDVSEPAESDTPPNVPVFSPSGRFAIGSKQKEQRHTASSASCAGQRSQSTPSTRKDGGQVLSDRDLLPSQRQRRVLAATGFVPPACQRKTPLKRSNASRDGSLLARQSSEGLIKCSRIKPLRQKLSIAPTDTRRLSFDHGDESLSLGISQEEAYVSASQDHELPKIPQPNCCDPDLHTEPTTIRKVIRRADPSKTFSQILGCVRRVPTALME
jgi:hypothetical protein